MHLKVPEGLVSQAVFLSCGRYEHINLSLSVGARLKETTGGSGKTFLNIDSR